jgi:pimeloyl-ACP methyl ester carboxylesterase
MTAENVLLLPGMMCDARQWAEQEADISQPVFHADTRKHDSMTEMARSVLQDAPDQFAMVGLSMGGILAFEIWRQASDRVSHLALLDTNPHAESPERQTMRLEQIAAAASGRLRELATESLKPLYLAQAHREDEKILATILDMAMDLGPDVFRTQSLALRGRVDSVPTLSSISCPTIVMCGDEDVLCPVAYHELMAAEIPNAQLIVIENCGHLSSLEQPEVVTRELQTLLAL